MECALKACIAKRIREHDFPEKDARKYFSHDLQELLGFAKLKIELDRALAADPVLDANWTIIQNWSEETRYEKTKTAPQAALLLNAIEDPTGGLLQWVRRRW